MKERDHPDERTRRVVRDPHDFVVRRIVVVRKIDVVVPEQVIGDQAALRVKNGGRVLETERLAGRDEHARCEAQQAPAIFRRRRERRIERQRPVGLTARAVERSLQVIRDPCLVVFGCVGR